GASSLAPLAIRHVFRVFSGSGRRFFGFLIFRWRRSLAPITAKPAGDPFDNDEEHRNQEDGEGAREDHAGYGDRPDQLARLSAGAKRVPQRKQAEDERERSHENWP